MSKASLELGGGNWAAKDGNLLGYAVGDTSGKYLPREFTFSRVADIGATRVNKDGLIEKYRENLIKSSNDFTATGWTPANSTVLSGYSGYDGTNDAWFLRADSSTFSRVAMLNTTSTGLNSTGLRTFSVYAKKKDYDYVGIYIQGSNKGVVFSLLDGTAVNSIISYPDIYSDGIEVGGGWWRFSISHPTTTSTTAAAIYACEAAAYDGNSNYEKGIYIQDAQFEYGLVATDYIETDSSTASAGVLDNLPRIDYTSGSAQLLMEPSRTNYFTYSEYASGNSLVNYPVIEENYAISPEGVLNAFRIEDPSGGAYRRVEKSHSKTTSQVDWTFSVFVKKATSPVSSYGGIALLFGGGDENQAYVGFDEYEGTLNKLVDSSTNANRLTLHTPVSYGDYWRFAISVSDTDQTSPTPLTNNNTTVYGILYANLSDDGNSIGNSEYKDFVAYGMQLEEGLYPTSYIPNYGTSGGVTRSQDVATVQHDIATNAWTVFMDVEDFSLISGDNAGNFSLTSYGSVSVNSLFLYGSCFGYHTTSGPLGYMCGHLGSSGTNFTGKFAVTYDGDNTMKVYVDGSLSATVTDAEPTKSRGIQELKLQYLGSTSKARKQINQVLIFPEELSQSEAQALTA